MKNLVKLAKLDLSGLNVILVGGTNGKGSVCAFLDSILREQGFQVGFYSSPHLLDVRERIRVGGALVSNAEFARLCTWAKPLVKEAQASFFETITALAFRHFMDKKIDWAVFEVGLGGRLDATNVLRPRISVITNVALEHTAILGNTVVKIAKEKAGIIHKGEWGVATGASGSAFSTIKRRADLLHVPLYRANRSKEYGHFLKKSNLNAAYQEQNVALALRCTDIMEKKGVQISDRALRDGIRKANWPGRFQIIGRVIVDGAHNPAGIRALLRSLDPEKKYALVFGVLSDKNYPEMIRLISQSGMFSEVYLATPPSSRGQPAETLLPYFRKQSSIPSQVVSSLHDALTLGAKKSIVVCGSLYMATAALSCLNAHSSSRALPRRNLK